MVRHRGGSSSGHGAASWRLHDAAERTSRRPTSADQYPAYAGIFHFDFARLENKDRVFANKHGVAETSEAALNKPRKFVEANVNCPPKLPTEDMHIMLALLNLAAEEGQGLGRSRRIRSASRQGLLAERGVHGNIRQSVRVSHLRQSRSSECPFALLGCGPGFPER